MNNYDLSKQSAMRIVYRLRIHERHFEVCTRINDTGMG